jgi:hypothetical protein
MSSALDFETYLVSKRIDSQAFKNSEPEMWNAWKNEFEQSHPNSFTVQKLNLINPIRRKYLLQIPPDVKSTETNIPSPQPPSSPKPSRPVMRPKPDLDSSG